MSVDFLNKGVSSLGGGYLTPKVATNIPNALKLTEYINFDYESEFTMGNGDGTKINNTGEEINTLYKPITCLFLAQLQFLTCYYKGVEEHPNPIVLYVPMSTSNLVNNIPHLSEGNTLRETSKNNLNHILLLSKTFPMFKFHVYTEQDLGDKFKEKVAFVDDYEINEERIIGDQRRIIVHRKIFTDEDAKFWSFGKIITPTLHRIKENNNKINIFYISDFSTDPSNNIISKNILLPDDVNNVNWSYMEKQKELFLKISPVKALLKFILPKPTIEALSISPDKGANRNYFEGVIFKRVWDSRYSREVSLVPNSDNREMEWNIETYDRMMTYNNIEKRPNVKFLNIINNSKSSINSKLHLENDLDSSLTVSIIIEYLRKFSYPEDPANIFTLISSIFQEFSEMYIVRNKFKK